MQGTRAKGTAADTPPEKLQPRTSRLSIESAKLLIAEMRAVHRATSK